MYQKEPDLRLPPASTTKVMTAVVALESDRKMQDRLPVSAGATRVPASKLYLRSGQSMSIKDLLYAVLLSSANDASLVLAEGIAGSVERFTDLMTRKAQELGAVNSHFTNPHGLTAPDHYSTVKDLAIIFKYAMENPAFREIIATKTGSVKAFPGGRRAKIRQIGVRNHNRLLWNFDGAVGGKTGYTHAAQKCFVGAVARNGVTLIVSILGSHNLWSDTRKLLEYGFDNYPVLQASAATPKRSRLVNGSMVARGDGNPSLLLGEAEVDKLGAGEEYVVQLASFREQDRAESLRKRLLESGFEVFLEKAALDSGETTYRVRVGPYAELLEAQEVAQEIEDKSGLRAIVLPMPVPIAVGD